MKPLMLVVAGALLLPVVPSITCAADREAIGPRLTPSVRPVLHSVYAGRYSFAAVDLRGERRTAGVGFIGVAADSSFRGYLRNHETGKVARFAGRVLRNGKLEFIPDFERVRHHIRILRRATCVHGLAGKYVIQHNDTTEPPPGVPLHLTANDVPEPNESGDVGADEVDMCHVIRTAGVVIGYRR